MIRSATIADMATLLAIENTCFVGDKLTKKQFRYMLTKAHASVLVAIDNMALCGYILILYRRGSSLARIYSIAILPSYRPGGWARKLVEAAEQEVLAKSGTGIRLEIRVDNAASIGLFTKMGYQTFGHYYAYYEDMTDAVRMQKMFTSTSS